MYFPLSVDQSTMDKSQISRIHSLDALRGLAAFWVLLAHSLGSAEGIVSITSLWYRLTPVRYLLSGEFPVIFFFVLSGFVLARQLLHQRSIIYFDFSIRRICRIYLPYAVSVLVAWVLANLIGTALVVGASENINADWMGSTSGEALLRHLLMLGRREDTNLNGVAWSLVVEMRVSLIFPVLMMFFTCSRWAIAVCGLTPVSAYFLANMIGQSPPFFFGSTIILSFIVNVYFFLPFVVGMSIAQYIDPWDGNFSPIASGAIVFLAMLGILFVMRIPSHLVQDLLYSIIGGILIVIALKSKGLGKILEYAIFQWLGRISYSLYLFHVIVLNALFKGLNQFIELPVLAIVAVPLSLLIAEIANRLIEQPAARLGRALSSGGSKTVTSPTWSS